MHEAFADADIDVVGFWIECVPRLKKFTDEDLEWHVNLFLGTDPSVPDDIRYFILAGALLYGLADQREHRAHMHRKEILIWPTRAQAQKVANAMDNEYWRHRVRVARTANSTAMPTSGSSKPGGEQ